MPNILITGGNGFIGKRLKDYLRTKNHEVTILARTNADIQKDIKDINENDLNKIDVVYHLASTVDNYNILSNPFLDIDVNLNGTITLLEAIRKTNNKPKLVYSSTFFVHGNPTSFPVKYGDKEEPLGLYGATKLCAEHFCKTYSRVYGLDVRIARLSNVYGGGDQFHNNKKSAFSRMIYLSYKGEPIKLYDGGIIKRDYIHVSDVVSALDIISEKGEDRKVYYVGNGVGVKFKELVDTIVGITGGPIENIESPKFHKEVGIDDFWSDVSPLKQLGWEPKMNLYDGINETIKYIKDNNI